MSRIKLRHNTEQHADQDDHRRRTASAAVAGLAVAIALPVVLLSTCNSGSVSHEAKRHKTHITTTTTVPQTTTTTKASPPTTQKPASTTTTAPVMIIHSTSTTHPTKHPVTRPTTSATTTTTFILPPPVHYPTTTTTTTSTTTTTTTVLPLEALEPTVQNLLPKIGQTSIITANTSGGSGGDTYEWEVKAPNSGQPVSAEDYCADYLSNTCSFTISSSTVAGNYQFLVVVTDSVGEQATSPLSPVITVYGSAEESNRMLTAQMRR